MAEVVEYILHANPIETPQVCGGASNHHRGDQDRQPDAE
jgi:hypothetical protein